MDALTNILNTLRMSSSLYFRTDLTAPWGVEVPAKKTVARFHIVIRGQCWIQIEGEGDWKFMANGDLVIVPHGASHKLADAKSTDTRPLDDVLQEVGFSGEGPLIYGGGGAGCCLVCGEFSFDALGGHPLLENLPKKLYVSGDTTYNSKWLENAIGFIGHEAASHDPGAHAIINRLSEIILIQVIRTTLAASKDTIPFLSAFTNSRINKVLTAIHKNPSNDWSVERLGQLANMSRSSFSNRFTELVRMTPLQYVIFVRLQQACRLLIETSMPLISIAERIGYRSEAAFSQVFKKQHGVRPGEFRRNHARIAS
ncbi:AraC family transcriptional regulator [Microbulbifer spongiae]|uniref:AraC family transcriptional regulator n=1 Tax=Microbulbifer spongiae TaxID=2944933 RepID=A0ABY9EFV9_9GAMM|nr:AraC family transcriptional regulator [Microbulbifer sp. MI-G]WKD50958.1 AraC family transcriptional regulator [Microbulbifer sp. MI-G]